MNLGKLPLFELLTRRMSWLNQRQEVLAHNVANADTPEFVPQDLKPMEFRRVLKKVAPVTPARTDPVHLVGTRGLPKPFREEEQRKRYETAPAGNAVILEEQMVKVAETQMEYQLVTNLYRKHVGMIKTAIGQGGR